MNKDMEKGSTTYKRTLGYKNSPQKLLSAGEENESNSGPNSASGSATNSSESNTAWTCG